ncbi:MAG: glutamate--tRNA ligase [Oligoflexia bacterium]|nr:glutamate--tRNA ligase [Oligoflexia bacterium]MBF0367425.1 glutamate--tRNA ligase [Oligoflexia bacterium]
MKCRVRFAPSPTGHLHIGGARTALYCYLFAKAQKGEFILRIEDTDQARSKREFEESQIADLRWVGIEYDEGPGKGNKGPYRQSERLDIYDKYAKELIAKGNAYYCFCSEEELEKKKAAAEAQNLAPIYDGTCRDLPTKAALERISKGEKAAVRFKAYPKSYSFHDVVRGDVSFPEGMVGDFIILRSDGLPVYNYCCVIDDALMEITHVLRAEEHLPNTLRQLMLYEALNVSAPIFGHLSLIVGDDRQKLSKRRGDTSVDYYREAGYIPSAMVNYLVQLGWSHPKEHDIYNFDELVSVFTIDRFSKSPSVLDLHKLKWINGQHLRLLTNEQIVSEVHRHIPSDHPYHQESLAWKLSAIELLKNQIDVFPEITNCFPWIFSDEVQFTPELLEILAFESTPALLRLTKSELEKFSANTFLTEEELNNIISKAKDNLKIKGKFLFQGIRALLTGKAEGPDLKRLITLTHLNVIESRIKKIQDHYTSSGV